MNDVQRNIAVLAAAIVLTFVISRIITLLVLHFHVLPKNVLSNNKRPHHFVYGNILVILTSFLVIVLNIKTTLLIVILYGFGIGLILDEFPHWLGNVKELTRNVKFIKGSIIAIIVSIIVLLGLFLVL